MVTTDDLEKHYGEATPLHELANYEVDSLESTLAQWFKGRGLRNRPRHILNTSCGWAITIGELKAYF